MNQMDPNRIYRRSSFYNIKTNTKTNNILSTGLIGRSTSHWSNLHRLWPQHHISELQSSSLHKIEIGDKYQENENFWDSSGHCSRDSIGDHGPKPNDTKSIRVTGSTPTWPMWSRLDCFAKKDMLGKNHYDKLFINVRASRLNNTYSGDVPKLGTP